MKSKISNPAPHVKLRLTILGWAYLAVLFLVGLAAVKNQAPMMFVLLGGLMGAFVFSAVVARNIIAAIGLTRDCPARAWQNQTVHLGYNLRNMHARRHCLDLRIKEIAPEGIESAAGYCVHLPPLSAFRAGGRFVVRKRGKISLKTLEVGTKFPFGLIRAFKRFQKPVELIVWPARGKMKMELLHRGAVEVSTAAPSLITGGQDEFFGLREYRAGDNPRWIHWRRSAGRTVPVVREMSQPLPEILYVIFDTHCADFSDVNVQVIERMLRFASTLVDHAFARGYKVGLTMTSAEPAILPVEGGLGQRCKILDSLATAEPDIEARLSRALSAMKLRMLRQAQVVLMTTNRTPLQRNNLSGLKVGCRHLTIIYEDDLAIMFQDNPFVQPRGN